MVNAVSAPPTTAPTLTPEQAELLIKGDLRNLAKKVAAGRTLSAAERNLLQAHVVKGDPSSVSGSWAKNMVELARILGIERKTIQRHLKSEGNPGKAADGRLNVQAWKAYLSAQGSLKNVPELNQTQLRARQLLLQNQKLEFQLAILRREYVPTVEVERWGGELGAEVKKVVQTIHQNAPSVVGVTVAEAEAILIRVEDEVLQQFHLLNERMANWKATHEPVAEGV